MPSSSRQPNDPRRRKASTRDEADTRVIPLHPGTQRRALAPVGGFPPLRLDPQTHGANVRCVLICEDEILGAEVASVAVRVGVEFRAVPEMTREHVAFALRNHAVVILVPGDNAIGAIERILQSGLDGPILVLERELDDTRRSVLLAHGATACHNLPITPRVLERTLHQLNQRSSRRLHVPLWFDPATHKVGIADRSVKLSPHEFSLLRCLVEHGGEAVTAARLRLYAWGANVPPRSEHQIVTVLICRLRKKLEQLGLAEAIEAVRGTGYAFRAFDGEEM